MIQLDLKIPTLVQHVTINEKPHFNLRPLFMPNPQVTNRRYYNALAIFKKEIRHFFKYYELNRDSSNELLWFLFYPPLELERRHLSFRMGNHFIEGNFMVIRFQVNQLQIVCLPAFNNSMYIEQTARNDQKINLSQLEKMVKKHLKREKDLIGDTFDPKLYYSGKKDYLAPVKVRVEIQFSKIKYLQETKNNFFAGLFDEQHFEGVVEIQKVGFDLNDKYPNELKRAFFREEVVNKLYQAIYQSKNTPIAIVGPEGVGRHTVIQEVIWRYLEQHQEEDRQPISIWQIDPTRVIAGMNIVGYWQKRFEAIIDYLIRFNKKEGLSHKMLVDNPVALLHIGRSANNDMTLSDVLKPYLEKRHLQLILISTPEEWTVFQEQDRSFSNLFQVLRLQEPKMEIAVQMILEQKKRLEAEHEVSISVSAINQLLYIYRNYFRNKALPGSVIKLLQQLAVKYREGFIEANRVREAFQEISGLQERIIDPVYTFDQNEVQNELARFLVGQQQAVDALADVIHLFKAKLNNKDRPVSSLLFIGPTGVGKTQAAKVLARYLMGSEDQMLRFDMNEYIDAYAIQRLIGDNYNPEGQLTGKVRYQPFGVLLFDEIEKAHPLVLDLLLQVLDDGRLTDSLGRTVDFTNSIIIMTSNVGAAEVGRMISIGRDPDSETDVYRMAVEKHFRPEFINRIDKTVIFRPLELQHILGIARLQINDLLKRDGFVRRTTILNISNDALEWVAQRGYDARMGGRALKRQIEKDLTALSAEQLLQIQSTSPILMDIDLMGTRLKPTIQSLEFVEHQDRTLLPSPEDTKNGSKFYGQLLERVERLIEQVNQWEENQGEDFERSWLYYQLKTRLNEVKDQLRTIKIAHSDRYYREALATPLRLKQCSIQNRRSEVKGGPSLEQLKARLFQEAALKEISDSYRYAPSEFDNQYSEFINHYLDVAFLELYVDGLFNNKYEPVTLRFSSLINGLGQPEIRFLLEKYQNLFEYLDLAYKLIEEDNAIEVQGYHLRSLLGGEEGIHLFYIAHRNPLPIRLNLMPGEEGTNQSLDVVRIFDGHKTLTDLRTGYTNAVQITNEEFKLLIFAGVEQFAEELH